MTDHTADQEAWASALHAHGRRVTKQRLAVLAAVQHHPHSPAEGILAAARKELPELTAQSVYVVLSDLTDLQMLRRFEPRTPRRSMKPGWATTTTTPSASVAVAWKTWTAPWDTHRASPRTGMKIPSQ